MNVREHRDELTLRVLRLWRLTAILIFIVAVAFWSVQGVRGAYYRELAENNRLRALPIEAPRGLIHDRQGRTLVENVPSYDLLLDPGRSADLDASLAFAAATLGRPAAELEETLAQAPRRGPFGQVRLAEGLSLAEVARFAVSGLEHPEFDVGLHHLRLYRHGAQTAHLLGYLGEVNAEELGRSPERYTAGDQVGRKGVEAQYDELLRGAAGERVLVVDSRGKAIEEYDRRPARPGSSLALTIDLELQQQAQRLMGERVGAVVALDPENGEVLALVSSPSYNPNHFARRLRAEEWRQLVDSPDHPLQNRALQSAYSPGSVFKIVMAVAGLAEGLIDPSDSVYCNGASTHYNRRFRCWKRSGHGRVNLHQAIKGSCDVYFYHLGQKMGIEVIADYARRFGLGRRTGIDLAGEEAGLVPDLEWARRARREPWYPGETISVSIGQGPLLTTPLQLAVLAAQVANGGRPVTPHLRRGTTPPPPPSTGLDPALLATVRRALTAVVNEEGGTARQARLPGYQVAGKTGTVQVIAQHTWTDNEDLPPELRDHAWFVSFAPAEAPELVVVVFVEHGGKGSQAAAPMARVLFETYFAGRGRLPA